MRRVVADTAPGRTCGVPWVISRCYIREVVKSILDVRGSMQQVGSGFKRSRLASVAQVASSEFGSVGFAVAELAVTQPGVWANRKILS